MKANWRIRFISKAFWVAIVPALLLLIQLLLKPLGINLDINFLGGYFLDVVNAIFVLLTILGVVNDPTVFGFKDSEQALNYEEPKKD